eukprot:CAMPEP_0117035782 /NCGR_PEP_ID=MMETSP0472-20121206/25389_1 /TAXON_ID=693140 ORGANISM="Tiarina fusus, Strain LIS" /NCGR_SAMPLE_ID=MMETSP0472 /ASSEMBLY_ACC=CAM_ASM_000603 /LENGTH=284 /DNA_ID=CAMNT_0004745349 /DNA_START=94 /DNA_END=951 /DNA_ORIENTATION=+
MWTNDPIKKAAMKKPGKDRGLGNKIKSEHASDFPSRPIEHSKSPYTIEHPKGISSTFLNANALKDNPGSFHKRKIVGRGPGSGLGKTAGRGTKGQKSRSGGSTRPGFEGGSNSLYKAVRKYGFKNPNKIDYKELNLNQLQLYIDTGRIVQPEDRPLTIRDLKDSGVFKGLNRPVKILGNGKDNFRGPASTPLNIEVQAVTASAREAIENSGGKVTTVYFNKLGLFQYLRKPHDSITIRFARPPTKKAHRYDVPVFSFPGRPTGIDDEIEEQPSEESEESEMDYA